MTLLKEEQTGEIFARVFSKGDKTDPWLAHLQEMNQEGWSLVQVLPPNHGTQYTFFWEREIEC